MLMIEETGWCPACPLFVLVDEVADGTLKLPVLPALLLRMFMDGPGEAGGETIGGLP